MMLFVWVQPSQHHNLQKGYSLSNELTNFRIFKEMSEIREDAWASEVSPVKIHSIKITPDFSIVFMKKWFNILLIPQGNCE